MHARENKLNLHASFIIKNSNPQQHQYINKQELQCLETTATARRIILRVFLFVSLFNAKPQQSNQHHLSYPDGGGEASSFSNSATASSYMDTACVRVREERRTMIWLIVCIVLIITAALEFVPTCCCLLLLIVGVVLIANAAEDEWSAACIQHAQRWALKQKISNGWKKGQSNLVCWIYRITPFSKRFLPPNSKWRQKFPPKKIAQAWRAHCCRSTVRSLMCTSEI